MCTMPCWSLVLTNCQRGRVWSFPQRGLPLVLQVLSKSWREASPDGAGEAASSSRLPDDPAFPRTAHTLLEHQARDRQSQTLSTVCFMVIAAPCWECEQQSSAPAGTSGWSSGLTSNSGQGSKTAWKCQRHEELCWGPYQHTGLQFLTSYTLRRSTTSHHSCLKILREVCT